MKTKFIYITLAVLFVVLFVVYLASKSSLNGEFTCGLFEYLDGTEQWIRFSDGKIQRVSIDQHGLKSETEIGNYSKEAFGVYKIHHKNSQMRYRVYPSILGLYIDDNDVKNLNLRMPRIGNVLYLRKL